MTPTDTDTELEGCTNTCTTGWKDYGSSFKSLDKDLSDVLTLRGNGILKTDTKDRVDIFHQTFVSMYTHEQVGDVGFIERDHFKRYRIW